MFSNILAPMLGSVSEQTLFQILMREFNSTNAWFKLRNYYPCNTCHFQWLCPSPGVYEQILKANNLCNVIFQ